MLNNGKHVLCEKALSMNLRQTTELINLAKKKGLFLMEAIWSRSFPIYDWIKQEIELGNLGDIKQVIVSLGLQLTGVDSFRYVQAAMAFTIKTLWYPPISGLLYPLCSSIYHL